MEDESKTHHIGCDCGECFAAFKTRFGAQLSAEQLRRVFLAGAEAIRAQLRKPTLADR